MAAEITKKDFDTFTWSDVYVPTKEDVPEVAKQFSLGKLQVQDSVQSGHLPKYEKTEKYTFLILRGLVPELPEKTTHLALLSNKIAIFYNDTEVITVHGGVFNFLHLHINDTFTCSEQLVLSILRNVISKFESPAKVLSEKITTVEESIFLHDVKDISLEEIYFERAQLRVAKSLLEMNRSVLAKMDISKKLSSEYQDIYEDVVHHMSVYEELYENSTNLVNTYLSMNAQRNNDIIRVLTIFSAFFLPLTFIVGVYGMNFQYFPEIHWHYGYPAVMTAMVAICIGIYIWFKKRGMM